MFVLYDQEGKTVNFNFAVDAREAIASGNFFEVNPKEEKEEKIPKPEITPEPVTQEKPKTLDDVIADAQKEVAKDEEIVQDDESAEGEVSESVNEESVDDKPKITRTRKRK